MGILYGKKEVGTTGIALPKSMMAVTPGVDGIQKAPVKAKQPIEGVNAAIKNRIPNERGEEFQEERRKVIMPKEAEDAMRDNFGVSVSSSIGYKW